MCCTIPPGPPSFPVFALLRVEPEVGPEPRGRPVVVVAAAAPHQLRPGHRRLEAVQESPPPPAARRRQGKVVKGVDEVRFGGGGGGGGVVGREGRGQGQVAGGARKKEPAIKLEEKSFFICMGIGICEK